ncbi:MAG TPA: hypothetical protein DCX06_07260 [Opitutae bacterium]|mgnify:CR=1 FL=1|nr:hypothetical protein [Opitutae bacterium]
MSTSPQTIWLAEVATSGHRRVWLAAFADALIQLGHQVVVLVPDPEPVRATLPSETLEGGNITFKQWDLPELPQRNRAYLSNLSTMLRRWRSLAREVKVAPEKPDLVILPFLDVFVSHGLMPQLLDRIFPFAWYGIYFQPQWTRINTAKHLKRPTCLFDTVAVQSKHCRGIGILDEGVATLVADKHQRAVDCFPDFIYPPIQAHASKLGAEVRERARSRTVVSFLGTIQSRKGFESFLKLLDAADSERHYFLIVGKFTPNRFPAEVLKRWAELKTNSPENVWIYNGAIEDDQDYYDLFRQSDVIWGAYENWPHSSNGLTLAAALKKPILVNEGYLMAERVRAFDLGVVLPRDCSANTLTAALGEIDADRSSQSAESFRQSQALAQLKLVLSSVLDRIKKQGDSHK